MDAQVLKSKLTDKNIVEIINKLGGELREDLSFSTLHVADEQ